MILDDLVVSLNLGSSVLDSKSLSGGALHKMWKVTSDKGIYVAKEINPHIVAKSTFPKSYEISELVANKFRENEIPAVAAIKINNKYVHKVGKDHFIIYPFINGSYVDAPALKAKHAEIIGNLFAKIHNLTLQVADIKEPSYHLFSNSHWEQLITSTKHKRLNELLEQILIWNNTYQEGIEKLNSNLIITHGDMHYKNILWNNQNHPHIIDWESVGLMNPVMEVVGYALEWSGAIHGKFNQDVCAVLLEDYNKNIVIKLDTDISIAFHGWLGLCVLGWTEFNIRRMLGLVSKDKEEISLGEDIINNKMISTLTFLGENQKHIIELLHDSWK